MEKREFKNKVYGELARITKAMGNPHRLEILDLLTQGAYSVEQIAGQTELTIANASQHLQVLKQARLVEVHKERNFVYYQLANTQVYEAWKNLRTLGISQIAEVERIINDYRSSHQALESVTCTELAEKIQNNESLVVLDVRPYDEYETGHISNAKSIPHDLLKEKLEELPQNTEVVAYCRGPLCVMADEAVEVLKQKGYKAKRLEDGYPEWEAKGFPVEINNQKS